MVGCAALALLLVLLPPFLLDGTHGHPVPGARSSNKLLLISFDGFRWDYDQDVDTPHLDQLARDGVKAKFLTPPFVTMTSPSHFTTITGEHCAWGPALGPALSAGTPPLGLASAARGRGEGVAQGSSWSPTGLRGRQRWGPRSPSLT